MTALSFAKTAMRRPARLLLAPLLLAGCATAPMMQTPTLAEPTRALDARAALVAAQPALEATPAPPQWWTLFNDPLLQALEAGLDGNLELQSAALRIEESRAQLGRVAAARRPDLGVDAAYSRAANSENSPIRRLGAPTAPYDTWSLGLQAGWEIDLWGRNARLADAAQARLEASGFDRAAVEVSVRAEVARTYLLLRGVQSQAALTQADLAIARDLTRLAESRQRNGVATRFDAASAQAEALALEARLTQLDQQAAGLMNALALLLGQPPRELDARLQAAAAPAMPRRLPIGVPSELARNRPDILQAEAGLRAAAADIGAAQADFYPRVSLTGNLGVQGFEPSELGSWASRTFAVGPSLHLPIFDGGRLRSQLALTETRHQLAGVAYRRTVLKAWHEVDDALNAYAGEVKRREQLEAALAHQETALAAALRAYEAGSTDFTAVLVARRSLVGARTALNDCATASSLAVVSLYRALGGGWSPVLDAEAAA